MFAENEGVGWLIHENDLAADPGPDSFEHQPIEGLQSRRQLDRASFESRSVEHIKPAHPLQSRVHVGLVGSFSQFASSRTVQPCLVAHRQLKCSFGQACGRRSASAQDHEYSAQQAPGRDAAFHHSKVTERLAARTRS